MNRAGWAVLVVVAIIAPFLFYAELMTQVLCLALFASAFNLLFGFAGMLSFGHAALFGAGSYSAALFLLHLGPHPFSALAAGTFAGALMGGAIGALAIRRSGVYLAMITLALAEIVYFAALQAPFTGGEDGLQGIPRGRLFGLIDLEQSRAMYFFALAVFLTGLGLLQLIIVSPFGLSLRAIRENESRALSLGYRIGYYRILAFLLSGLLSGAAGAVSALAFHFASLDDVHWHKSGEVILTALLGGAGTLIGPTLGAVLVVLLTDTLATIGEWVNFLLGAIFVACVLVFRDGIAGTAGRLWEMYAGARRRGARQHTPKDVEPFCPTKRSA